MFCAKWENGLTVRIQRLQAFPKPHQRDCITHSAYTGMIDVINLQKDMRICSRSVRAIVGSFLRDESMSTRSLGVVLVSEKKIRELHGRFFSDDSITDCISFPSTIFSTTVSLGEVVVCPKVALQYALKHHSNPYREMALYLIHGMLHLIGYDDIDPKQKKRMRKKEKSCMKRYETLIQSLHVTD